MMKMKTYALRLAAFCMAVMVNSEAVSFTAYAAGPLADKVNSGYDEETWSKLQDNILEYDEIPLLVHEYNLDISEVRRTLNDTVAIMEKGLEELQSQKRKIEDLKDKNEDDGNYEEAAVQSMILKGYGPLPSMNSIIGSYASAINSVSAGKSTIRQLQQAEDAISDGARGLMITYNSVRAQLETLQQMQALYNAQYQIAVNKQSLGMATETDIYQAQVNQLMAENNIQALESGLLQMKPILCRLTGWPADADPEIAQVPAIDLNELAQRNLEEDTRKAIGNNDTLQEQRHSAAGKTNDGVAARKSMIDEGDEKLTIEMKRLYDDVDAKITAYEAARTGLEAAEKTRAYNERRYAQGILSKSDYLGLQLAYYQKKVAFEGAELDLRTAELTYDQAVRGTATVAD